MNDFNYIEPAVETKPLSLREVALANEQAEKLLSQYGPLPEKMVVGTLAYEFIRKHASMKFGEIAICRSERAGLLGIPIEVVAWMPPKHIVLLDREGHVIKTLECE